MEFRLECLIPPGDFSIRSKPFLDSTNPSEAMNPIFTNKKIRWAVIFCIVLFISASVFLWFIPPWRLLQGAIKDNLIPYVSGKTGIDITYRRMEISLFPSPYVIIKSAEASKENVFTARIPEIRIMPVLSDLIAGKLSVNKVQLDSPDIRYAYGEEAGFPLLFPGQDKTDDNSTTEEKSFEHTRIGKVNVRNASVTVTKNDKEWLTFNDMDAILTADAAKVSFTSNIIDRCSANVVFGKDETSGQITLTHFKPESLSDLLLSDSDFAIDKSLLDLSITFKTNRNDKGKITGSLAGEFPYLSMIRAGKRKSVYKVKQLLADFEWSPKFGAIYVRNLTTVSPAIVAEGVISQDFESGMVNLVVKGKNTDIDSVRQLITIFSKNKDLPFFDVVQKGVIPQAEFKTVSKGWDYLDAYDNFTIDGFLEQGDIYLKNMTTTFTGVKGRIEIAKGILNGYDAFGHYKNNTVRSGSIWLSLKEDVTPYRVNLDVDADLAEMHPYLIKVVKNKKLIDELKRISNVSGSASGRLIMGDDANGFNINVTATDVRMTCTYEPIPYHVAIRNGTFSYDGETVIMTGKEVAFGTIHTEDLSITTRIEKDYPFDLSVSRMELDIKDLLPVVKKWGGDNKTLNMFSTIRGSMIAAPFRVKGNFNFLEDADYELSGLVNDFSVKEEKYSRLGIQTGHIIMTKGRLDLSQSRLCYEGDCFTANVSVCFGKDVNEITASFKGNLHQNLVSVLNNECPLKFKHPITVEYGQIHWKKGTGFSFNGKFNFDRKTEVAIELKKEDDNLNIGAFKIRDDDSFINYSAYITPSKVMLNGNGKLSHVTIDRLLLENPYLSGSIEGNFTMDVNRKKPWLSSMTGLFKGDGLQLPTEKGPVQIDSFQFSAVENTVRIESLNMSFANSLFHINGDVSQKEKEVFAEIYLDSEGLDYKNIKRFLNNDGSEQKINDNGSTLPLTVKIHLNAASLNYEKYRFAPLGADIVYENKELYVSLNKAELCGLSLSGDIIRGGREMMNIHAHAMKKDVKELAECLLGMKAVITGTYDLDGVLTAEGPAPEKRPENIYETKNGNSASNTVSNIINQVSGSAVSKKNAGVASEAFQADENNTLEALSGDIRFKAYNGGIDRFGFIAKVLTFLNIRELASTGIPSLAQKGMAYNTIDGDFRLEKGKLIVKDGHMDGVSMGIAVNGEIDLVKDTIDLKLLVAPFKTVDWVVRNTPITNDILNGTLITIPISATGSLKDPMFTFLSPRSVGEGLLGIMKRTITLPVKIFEPILNAAQKDNETDKNGLNELKQKPTDNKTPVAD